MSWTVRVKSAVLGQRKDVHVLLDVFRAEVNERFALDDTGVVNEHGGMSELCCVQTWSKIARE